MNIYTIKVIATFYREQSSTDVPIQGVFATKKKRMTSGLMAEIKKRLDSDAMVQGQKLGFKKISHRIVRYEKMKTDFVMRHEV